MTAPNVLTRKRKDLAARAGWTAAQAGLAVITVEALDVPVAWVGVVAAVLSALKSFVAGKVGDKDSVTFS